MPQCTFKGRSSILLTVLLFAFAQSLRAQLADLQRDRVPMAEITAPWRFHMGDDPRWADPAFDDSAWVLLKSNQDWNHQGYPDYAGFAWYRFKLFLPADSRQYALYLPGFSTSYQVFADGHPIAEYGGMPPNPRIDVIPPVLIPLPRARSGQPIVIAFRVWQKFYGASIPTVLPEGGGPWGTPRVGELATLRDWAFLQSRLTLWTRSSGGLLVIALLIGGIAGLSLFALRPGEREYLWFGLFELFRAIGLAALISLTSAILHFWRIGFDAFILSFSFAANVALLFFLSHLLNIRRSRLIRWALASSAASNCLGLAGALYINFSPGILAWGFVAVSFGAWNLAILPYWACVALLLWRAVHRGVLDARLLLFPVSFYAAISVLYPVLSVLGSRLAWISGPLFFAASEFLVQISLLAILLLLFVRTRQDEEQMKQELEAARTVQQVLIPARFPAIPGFHIDCVYEPASQVGGDFFQIFQAAAGSALITIGDVSGKGMPAAMTVSCLIGALRTGAENNTSPATLLDILNRCALAHSIGGFATCLILRIDSTGQVTAANAGHLAPYLNGKELVLVNGLPVGIDSAATYSESTFALSPNDDLTLMTDGVVEARNKQGELYGFDRAASLATGSAESIARSAQSHGQEDDITVIKITRQPNDVPAISVEATLTARSLA